VQVFRQKVGRGSSTRPATGLARERGQRWGRGRRRTRGMRPGRGRAQGMRGGRGRAQGVRPGWGRARGMRRGRGAAVGAVEERAGRCFAGPGGHLGGIAGGIAGIRRTPSRRCSVGMGQADTGSCKPGGRGGWFRSFAGRRSRCRRISDAAVPGADQRAVRVSHSTARAFPGAVGGTVQSNGTAILPAFPVLAAAGPAVQGLCGRQLRRQIFLRAFSAAVMVPSSR
jgi:hypothetical protein